MKFKELNIIENTFIFESQNNSIFLSRKTETTNGEIEKYELISGSIKERIALDVYCTSIINFRDYIFCTTSESTGIFIDRALHFKKRIPEGFKVAFCHKITDFIPVFRGKIKNREFGIYSISENQVLWFNKNFKALEIFGDILLGQSNFEIIRVDPKTGEVIWELNLKLCFTSLLEKNGKANLIDVSANSVIVGLEQIDKVISVNIENGDVQWQINTFSNGLKVDSEKGILLQMLVNYSKYDLNTGEMIDNFNNSEYFESCEIESQRSNYVLVDDHIITTDWRKGNIGAFNTKTHKFDWIERIDGVSFPSPKPIKYSDPYLFVHDSNNTLHIFERE